MKIATKPALIQYATRRYPTGRVTALYAVRPKLLGATGWVPSEPIEEVTILGAGGLTFAEWRKACEALARKRGLAFGRSAFGEGCGAPIPGARELWADGETPSEFVTNEAYEGRAKRTGAR